MRDIVYTPHHRTNAVLVERNDLIYREHNLCHNICYQNKKEKDPINLEGIAQEKENTGCCLFH